MKKNKKAILWLVGILFVLAVFISLVIVFMKQRNITEKDGTLMEREDAYILFAYLCCRDEDFYTKSINTNEISEYLNPDEKNLQNDDKKVGQKEEQKNDPKPTETSLYLTKSEALYMIEVLKELYPLSEGDIIKNTEALFVEYSKDQSKILADDFFSFFYSIWDILHAESALTKKEIVPLAYGKDVQTLDEATSSFVQMDDMSMAYYDMQSENNILVGNLTQGLYDLQEGLVQNQLYQNTKYLFCNHYILLDISKYYDVKQKDFQINTAFIVSNQPDALFIEYQDYRLNLHTFSEPVKTENGEIYDSFENIADVFFANGRISYLEIYKESVSGKLLCISDDIIELEGAGTYTYNQKLPVYKLYGNKEIYTKADLKIGYDFADFVLNKDGVIVAALVTREENMDNIRVVIKTTNFASAYHESITLSCDQDYLVNNERHMAGEEFTVTIGDEILKSGRIFVRPETNLAKTSVLSIQRDQGIPSYRGNFEITETNDGLLLINEVLLEEYLYSVVPSEMPASYPSEALKAQAICARTYAYGKMVHSGLMSYGAHVDDSAAFQVYNNIKENENTTLAIRETKDWVLTIDNHPAEVYYYSTSCGFGTDIDAWHGSNADQYRYMLSKHISDDTLSDDITNEDIFRNYISNIQSSDYESGEGWYRWTYETALNIDRLNQNLLKRYEAGSKNVATLNEAGEYEPLTPPVFTKLERMEVVKREDGGVIDELLLSGPEGCIKVIGEHNVRAVLANDCDYVIRANQSQSTVSTLLPSAFAVIDVTIDETSNSISAYRITGGGYGHGIGMSQNGAKAMANKGWLCNDILKFFFENAEVLEL